MKISRRELLQAALAAAMTGIGRSALAQAFPSKPIRIIVPFPAGGATDLLARLVAEKLSASLPQPVICENRSGAGGNLGAVAVAKATADGYTLLMGSPGTQSINTFLYADPGYDGIKDFQPISLVAKAPNLLVVHPSIPVSNMTEFIAYAKQNPGLFYGHTSVGGTKHLAGELLRLKAGIDIVPVAYKGSAPMMTDLLGGHIKFAFDDLITSLPHVTTKSIRAIAITGQVRWPSIPDVPRVAEMGGALADYDVTAWYGLLAPTGTPAAIVARLSDLVVKALNIKELRDRLFAQGVEPMGTTPDEYMAFILAEHRRWGEVIRAAKIQLK